MLTLALPLLMAATPIRIQEPMADKPKVELKLDAKTAIAGVAVKGKVVVTIPDGWHGYQNPPMRDYEIPLKISTPTKGLVLKPTYPKGKEIQAAGAKTWAYEGRVEIPVSFTFPMKPGLFTFKVDANYQLCNDQTCLPPDTVSTEAKIAIRAPQPIKPKSPSGGKPASGH